jgi:hypothetical protein
MLAFIDPSALLDLRTAVIFFLIDLVVLGRIAVFGFVCIFVMPIGWVPF